MVIKPADKQKVTVSKARLRLLDAIALTKREIRSKILKRLNIQKEEDRDKKSRILKEKLFKTPVFKSAKTVMFYIAFDGEVKTEEMIRAAQRLGKMIVVPVCVRHRKNRIAIIPCLLRKNAPLAEGFLGVCEPQIKKPVSLKNIDLVVVPGVAFDKKGNRLGRGKGCYDYFLSKLGKDTPTIGLAYDFQVLVSLPTTENDYKVNRILFA